MVSKQEAEADHRQQFNFLPNFPAGFSVTAASLFYSFFRVDMRLANDPQLFLDNNGIVLHLFLTELYRGCGVQMKRREWLRAKSCAI